MSLALEEVPAELLDRALQLAPSARRKFGNLLLDSVVEADATRALIHSRIAKLVSGEAVLHDADDVIDELERRYSSGDQP